jgi:hypothetical protein
MAPRTPADGRPREGSDMEQLGYAWMLGEGDALSTVIGLAILVLIIAGIWRTFEKAGQPGWAAIIPIYNLIVLLQVARKPIWWILLFLVPIVNLIVAILVPMEVARLFGKGVGFGLGLAFFGFIFFPILGFGSAQYQAAPATNPDVFD